jgi:cell shape-determining protein MreD
MRSLLLLSTLAVASVAQTVLPCCGWPVPVRAPILLGVVLYYAFTRERAAMLATAVLAGLFRDALDLVPLGFSSGCFCIIALAVERLRDVVFASQGVTHLVFGSASAGALALAGGLFLGEAPGSGPSLGRLISYTVASALFGAVTVPVVCRLLTELDISLGTLHEGART